MGIHRELTGSSRRVTLAGLAALALLCASAPGALAAEWNKRWFVGMRLGDFLNADKQKGGFRGDRNVSISEVPLGTLSFGRGVKKWGRCQLVLELQVSNISATFGDETVYLDADGSTRVEDPVTGSTGQTGDETYEPRTLGDITMTPVFANALFHWSGKGDPDRADFYVGGGLGVVLADFSESSEYREFASDYDGDDDISVDSPFALLLKVGANVRLAKNHDWYLYFEGEFMATQVITGDAQISWASVDYLAGSRSVDTDNNGSPDVTVPADFRLMDPGHVRMDGAIFGIGIRYRFGGTKAKAKAAAEAAAASDAPVPEEPAAPQQ